MKKKKNTDDCGEDSCENDPLFPSRMFFLLAIAVFRLIIRHDSIYAQADIFIPYFPAYLSAIILLLRAIIARYPSIERRYASHSPGFTDCSR